MRVGDRVTLLPFEETDQPEEQAILLGFPEQDGDPYLVRVLDPEDPFDDGLREVPAEQIKGVS